MAARIKSRFWRKCRIIFRRFRIFTWCVILILLGGVLYLNQIGLPGFVKSAIQDRLRARGLDLQFTRMRWRWERGIVAENVRFGGADTSSGPQLFVKEAQLRLDNAALLKLQVQVNSLVLRNGKFSWQIAATNDSPSQEITVENIQTELRFLPGDVWELDQFQAQLAGANILLGGVVTNASAIRQWDFLNPGKSTGPGVFENRLRQLADGLRQVHFSTSPELDLDVRGDALDLKSFSVRMTLNAPDAATPWGTIRQGLLTVQLLPATTNLPSHAEVSLTAAEASTQWAGATNLNLKLDLLSDPEVTNVIQARLNLSVTNVVTKWGEAGGAHMTAQWLHSITNAIPLSGSGELWAAEPKTKWGQATQIHFASHLLSSTNILGHSDESWGWWTNVAPYSLNWECELSGLESDKASVSDFSCYGEWNPPDLSISQFICALYNGMINAQARVNIATRDARFSGSSDVDEQRIPNLIPEKAKQWLSQFTWKIPPKINVIGSMTLPAWTYTAPDWQGEVLPTVRLDGRFALEDTAFRGISFSSAESHFSLSNLVWRLPDLVARRPEGRLNVAHVSNGATHDFYFRIHSSIDPRVVRPLLGPDAQEGLDLVTFTEPPIIDGELWGRGLDNSRLGGRGSVALTNFAVRGETVGSFESGLEYTNGILLCIAPHAETDAQHASATSMALDFAARKIYLTNGVGTADPLVICRMIGPNVAKVIEPYHFLRPPTGRVEGTIPMGNPDDADLHFDASGGPLEWWKFHIPEISGKVDWVGNHLTLTNVAAQFYRGGAYGHAEFEFPKGPGVNLQMDFNATNANLHLLMADLVQKTNKLEGTLTAHVTVTQANTADLQTIAGRGRVNLHDGFIWEIPVFGLLSPALDSITPGLGSSRASEGSASFTITNGVIRSENLEIRASIMRLQYWGTVDFEGRLNARAQAQLLRDTWMVGRVISLALWPVSKIFEYKITGTLNDPKSQPVFFIPKIVLMPFHPIRTLKDLMPEEPQFITNTPAFGPQP